MDLDNMLRQVRDLTIANQNMGAQIAELMAFKDDAERRLAALEPDRPAEKQKPAGEPQDAPPANPDPTPAEDPAKASPEPPQSADKP